MRGLVLSAIILGMAGAAEATLIERVSMEELVVTSEAGFVGEVSGAVGRGPAPVRIEKVLWGKYKAGDTVDLELRPPWNYASYNSAHPGPSYDPKGRLLVIVRREDRGATVGRTLAASEAESPRLKRLLSVVTNPADHLKDEDVRSVEILMMRIGHVWKLDGKSGSSGRLTMDGVPRQAVVEFLNRVATEWEEFTNKAQGYLKALGSEPKWPVRNPFFKERDWAPKPPRLFKYRTRRRDNRRPDEKLKYCYLATARPPTRLIHGVAINMSVLVQPNGQLQDMHALIRIDVPTEFQRCIDAQLRHWIYGQDKEGEQYRRDGIRVTVEPNYWLFGIDDAAVRALVDAAATKAFRKHRRCPSPSDLRTTCYGSKCTTLERKCRMEAEFVVDCRRLDAKTCKAKMRGKIDDDL